LTPKRHDSKHTTMERNKMIQKLTLGLHPWQSATVVAVFFLTLVGAILVAWGFRKWNNRKETEDAQ